MQKGSFGGTFFVFWGRRGLKFLCVTTRLAWVFTALSLTRNDWRGV